MEEEATQPATQQFMDPRRNGEATSDLSDADLCDILCILHPASASSVAVCAAIAEASPDNTVSRASIPIRVRGATPGTENAINTQHLNGTMDQAERGIVSRDIALRLSADLKDPLAGYTFGRNPERCDFVINPPSTDGSKRISNIHFRIWFTEQSNVIMLEDQSTNGTWVEGKLLRAKHKESGGLYRHILVQGTLIRLQMIAGRDDDLKFVVRIPSRETGSLSQGLDEIWERNVQAWFENLRRVRHGREEEARKKEGRATGQTPDIFASNQNLNDSVLSRRPKEWKGGAKYNKGQMIGKGAFAAVYMLTDKFDGTQYAAKEILKRQFVKNGIVNPKIEHEMNIMKQIHHDNIVRFIEHINWVDHLYIIMDYIPCGSLTTLIDGRGPLPELAAKIFAHQMLDALKYLHGIGITHRDIKPDNILVQSWSPNLHVKLTDFGLSKRILPEEDTFLRTFCGTILYCAPEVYPDYYNYGPTIFRETQKKDRRSNRYDNLVDIWSLGGVIFYSITKQPPWPATEVSIPQMLHNVMTMHLETRPLYHEGLSQDGVEFIRGMLSNTPQKRAELATIAKLEAHPWLTGRRADESIESADTDIQPGRRAIFDGQDTPMTDVDAEDSGQYSEVGLEQSASQLSIYDQGGATGEESDEVDLVANTRGPRQLRRGSEAPDSQAGDSSFEHESFDFAAHVQNRQSQAATHQAAYPISPAQPPSRLFGEVPGAVTNTNSPTPAVFIRKPRQAQILRRDFNFQNENRNPSGFLTSSIMNEPNGGGPVTNDSSAASLHEDQVHAQSVQQSPAINRQSVQQSQAIDSQRGHAPSLLGAESLVQEMALTSASATAGQPAGATAPLFGNGGTGASLRRPREADDHEDGRPEAKRHHSVVLANAAGESDVAATENAIIRNVPLIEPNVFFDPEDRRTHHLNYPPMTQQEHDEMVLLARTQGEEFKHGGKLFDTLVKENQEGNVSHDEGERAATEAGVSTAPGPTSERKELELKEGLALELSELPFGGKYGGWLNGVPTKEIAKYFPEWKHYHGNLGPIPGHALQTANAAGNDGFQAPRRILAKLISTPDSVLSTINIPTTEALTTWGRGYNNTIRYLNGNEDRVPKNAIKIVLWAPGLQPGAEVPATAEAAKDHRFFIATKATHGIKVNNVPILSNKPNEPQKEVCLYWGELRHGDVIEAWCHLVNRRNVVRIRFECFWGGSKEERKPGQFFDVLETGTKQQALDRFCQWEESRIMKERYERYEREVKEKEERTAARAAAADDTTGTGAGEAHSAGSSQTDDDNLDATRANGPASFTLSEGGTVMSRGGTRAITPGDSIE